jgi:hypothetical protein
MIVEGENGQKPVGTRELLPRMWLSRLHLQPILVLNNRGTCWAHRFSSHAAELLVDTGIYAIVRHPQGDTAWLLINMSDKQSRWFTWSRVATHWWRCSPKSP